MEEAEQIKTQLLEQISNFPEDKREMIKEKILSMSDEELEEFISQNGLGQQCLFCSIVSGKIPSYNVAEDAENTAVLDINPAGKGHTLVLSKSHSSKPSLDFIKRVSEMIRGIVPKMKVVQNEIMGHKIVELVPEGEEKRKRASESELQSVLDEIKKSKVEEKEKKPKKERKPRKKKEVLVKLKPRIP